MAHHHHGTGNNEVRLGIAAAITGIFMIAEVIGGVVSGSLALIADAGHMLTDFAALSLAWFAFRLERRPADWKRTYGFDRFQIIVAFANGIALFLIAGWIVVEAVDRLNAPAPVDSVVMASVAAAGLVVNIVAFLILHGADRDNLNIRGAALHVLGDLLGSVAALLAAAIIFFTGWTAADPILSVVVALIILRSAWAVVSESGHILLEGAPARFDVDAVKADLIDNIPGVQTIHHVHAWSITQERCMVTLHAVIADDLPAVDAIAAIKARLADHHDIDHATVEVERRSSVSS
ncbi:MAG: cation diffusion facilitator family transporter [Alphaproteobacteria bacterium]